MVMQLSQLSRRIRALLDDEAAANDRPPLQDVLDLLDRFTDECSSSAQPEVGIYALEHELQTIYDDLVAHSSVPTGSAFLAVLSRLEPLLSSSSIISNWFDTVLRPSLRNTKLPSEPVQRAQELVLSALDTKDNHDPEKIVDFRRRLFDLYLLDVFNEGSTEDMLEWAEMSDQERSQRQKWKGNLEQILLAFGHKRPAEMMTEIYDHFMTPSSRLQLLIFFNTFISESYPPPDPHAYVPILAQHPLLLSLLSSLLIDSSSTSCNVALSLLIKIIPLLACHARDQLQLQLPYLFAIVQRVLCWRGRPVRIPDEHPEDTSLEQEIEIDLNPSLPLKPDLGWERLQATFKIAATSAPVVRPLFTILYYLFPHNMLQFLRAPIAYIAASGLDCPFECGWEDAIDQSEVGTKSERLVRSHTCHPSLFKTSAAEELSDDTFWRDYDVPRICTEAKMLDVRNTAIAIDARYGVDIPVPPVHDPVSTLAQGKQKELQQPHPSEEASEDLDITLENSHEDDNETSHTSHRIRVSLEKILAVTAALKSNISVDIVEPTSRWAKTLALSMSESPAPQRPTLGLPHIPSAEEAEGGVAPHISETLTVLMREVLLLRNELNFELWLSRENAKHVGRLYEDKVVTKNAEAERQGLYNKLRRYRAQVVTLERELKEIRDISASSKSKYEDWTTELHQKLRNLRKEKDGWLKESAALRDEAAEAQSMFEAQKTLLADALKKVFDLETQRREVQHKIDRLRDYERQIEQHVKIQKLWDSDFAKFNQRAEEIDDLRTVLQQMRIRQRSYEETNRGLEEQIRHYHDEIQALQSTPLLQVHNTPTRLTHQDDLSSLLAENAALVERLKREQDRNEDLNEEMEELRAMVEVLRGQVSMEGLGLRPPPPPVVESEVVGFDEEAEES